MGLAIDRQAFSEREFAEYRQRLDENLAALEQLFQRPGFGELGDDRKIGSEVELYLVDSAGRPAQLNQEIQRELNDARVTLELNRFNLEFNSTPQLLQRQPISRMAAEISEAIEGINRCAAPMGCSAMPIGILPSAQQQDFGFHAMTDLPRYHALTRQLQAIRGGPFRVHISGLDELDLSMEDVTLEGANTSFQLHYQVRPEEFADAYNALQLVTPLVVACAANSPIVFGRQLWHETRIPLFKQSIDCRPYDPDHPTPARVNFGHAWVRSSAMEIFTEAVRLYRPLLPICSEERAVDVAHGGGTPSLQELRLQQSSVWLWNRPVFDPEGQGHLRIEARAMPAGPTVQDMMANAVLTLGLMESLRPKVQSLLAALPFEYCARNFYRAAQLGLQAELYWPDAKQNQPSYLSCRQILQRLLPRLPEALERIGIARQEYAAPLELIAERLDSGQTGAVWQLQAYEGLQRELPSDEALRALVYAYESNNRSGKPVSRWSMPD